MLTTVDPINSDRTKELLPEFQLNETYATYW